MDSAFIKRRKRILEHIVEKGMDKAVIINPQNICYLTGIRVVPYERLFLLIIDAVSESCSFVMPNVDKELPLDPSVNKLLYVDEDDPADVLKETLGDFNVLGVEMGKITLDLYNKIRNCSHAVEMQDVGQALTQLRLHKDIEEIDLIRTAVSYSDQVFNEIAAKIKPGITEKAILADIFNMISAKEGAVTNPFIIQALCGEHTASPHGEPGDRKLEKGDPLTIDFSVCYAYYWSDCTRTFFLGQPDPRMEIIYKINLAAQEKAFGKIKPGVKIKELDIAARSFVEKAGYGKYYLHRTGHGIGLDVHELPNLHSVNEEYLEEGMTFTVEPGIYVPGLGGVRIEDNVLVTADGVEILSRYPKEFSSMIL
ncbi:MAG: Xaa-Pro peptidase family protein [Bacillota bacterium]|nr:Xaa-Pro peptidase family protein [Bacillota bacterium]MDW7728935.1 Xaa-Pro peptidase family protein [Bacillota bacterium]